MCLYFNGKEICAYHVLMRLINCAFWYNAGILCTAVRLTAIMHLQAICCLITCQYSTYVSMDIILQYTPFFALKLYPREHSEHCFHKIRLIVANEIAYLKKTFYWHSMYMYTDCCDAHKANK